MAGRTVAASQKIAMVTVGGEVIPFARATLLPADRAQKSHEKRLAIAKALGDLDSIAHALWAIARVELQQERVQAQGSQGNTLKQSFWFAVLAWHWLR
jgi:hypothetical protein